MWGGDGGGRRRRETDPLRTRGAAVYAFVVAVLLLDVLKLLNHQCQISNDIDRSSYLLLCFGINLPHLSTATHDGRWYCNKRHTETGRRILETVKSINL